jgi:integrase
MTPKVTYRIKRDTLHARIKLHGVPEALFDTGISALKEKFDANKQISGDPKVHNYMHTTSEAIRRLFVAGMNPKQLWDAFIMQSAAQESSYLVKDAFDYYLRTYTRSHSTISTIMVVKSKVELAGLMDKPIKDITGAVMREFISSLQSRHKESTIYETYMKFKTVLNRYIKENGLAITLPIDGLIRLPKKKEEGEPEYLVWDEVKKLLAVELADPKEAYFRDLFCLMCMTGMSVGDLLLFSPKSSVSPDGKWFNYNRKKTSSSCVSIPLLPAAKGIIDRNIWPVRVSVRTLQNKCDIISELIGRKIKTHGARKTYGCVMLELGFTIEAVSGMMGHSSISTTEKFYVRVTRAKIEREMSNLPEAIKQIMGV